MKGDIVRTQARRKLAIICAFDDPWWNAHIVSGRSMPKRPTSPVLRSWTEKAALRETKKRLTKIDALLREIGGLWGDVDECIVRAADELRRDIEQFNDDIEENIAARAQERAARD
ncbi:MAG: hypothetical protein WD073_09920 [Xanthobacteraceae bacterium]